MFNCSYMTVKEMQEYYVRQIREYERQSNYERNIVRSVPEKSELNSGTEVPAINGWKPG